MSCMKIKAANLKKKQSARKKRSARLQFWLSESRALRKRNRKTLTGAAILTVSLTMLYAILGVKLCRLLYTLSVPHELLAAVSTATAVFGIMLFSALNFGGRRLALLLYRKAGLAHNERITVGELFYSFGEKENRKVFSVILRKVFRAITVLTAISLILLAGFAFLGKTAGTVLSASVVFCVLLFFPQSRAAEWLFILDRRGSKTLPCKRLSSYAMLSHSGETKRLFFFKLKRAVISIPTLAIGYLPYAWALDSVSTECISSELIRRTTN